jgi:hypothetical protein
MHWYLILLFNPDKLLAQGTLLPEGVQEAENEAEYVIEAEQSSKTAAVEVSNAEAVQLGLDKGKSDKPEKKLKKKEEKEEKKSVKRCLQSDDIPMDVVSRDDPMGVYPRKQAKRGVNEMGLEYISPRKEDEPPVIGIPSSPDPLQNTAQEHLPGASEILSSLQNSHLEDRAALDTQRSKTRRLSKPRRESDLKSDDDDIQVIDVQPAPKRKKTKEDKEFEAKERVESMRNEFRMFTFDSLGHARPKAISVLKEYSSTSLVTINYVVISWKRLEKRKIWIFPE